MSTLAGLDYEPLPEDVASWLERHAWTCEVPAEGRPAKLWTKMGHEVLQPLLRSATDYPLRLSSLLSQLATWVEQTPEAVAQEMLHEGADVIEWRASGSTETDHTLPLEDALGLVRGVRNAVVAAANAAVNRRGYFGHSSSQSARNQARSVRMGQTRRGSYIVPIISRTIEAPAPSAQEEGGEAIPIPRQPYERRVLLQLAESLEALHEMAVQQERAPSKKQINESVAAGVSYEMCSALSDVLGGASLEAVDVSFTWARRSLPTSRAATRANFPTAAASIIDEIGQNLRDSDIVAEQTITGRVTSHNQGTRRDDVNSVYLRAMLGETVRRVRLDVNREQLQRFLRVASEAGWVTVKGRVKQEPGRAWKMEDFTFLEGASHVDMLLPTFDSRAP